MDSLYFQHLCTHNDRNGNPRRLYVLIVDGTRVAAWDEGYSGCDAVPGLWRDKAYRTERAEITPGLYNELRRTLPSPRYADEVPGFAHLRELV
jgi:hypothetical protein